MGSYGLCVKVNGCQFGRAQVLLVWWNWETASRQMRRCGIGDVEVAHFELFQQGLKLFDSQVRPIIGRNGAFLHIAGTDHWV